MIYTEYIDISNSEYVSKIVDSNILRHITLSLGMKSSFLGIARISGSKYSLSF
jgi:hypothetical protein